MDESSKGSAMLPDSTQSGNSVSKRKTGKKRKKKDGTGRKKLKGGRVKDQKAKADADATADDLDLTKPLYTIGHYISDREEMLQQAFQSVSKEQIDAMLPEVLKDCSMDVIKALCLGQLEGMSKKRIFHVLTGEEMLSSSDTDESENEIDPQQDQSQADTAEQPEDGLEPQTDGFEPQTDGFEQEIEEGFEPQAGGFENDTDDIQPQEDGFEPQGDGVDPEEHLREDPDRAMSQEGTEYEPSVDDNPMCRGQAGAVTPEPEMGNSPEYILDSSEEVIEDPPPVRKKRKKRPKKPRLINPTDLEEGEVSEESSEYTDASDDRDNAGVPEIEGALTETPHEVSEGAMSCNTVQAVSNQQETGKSGQNAGIVTGSPQNVETSDGGHIDSSSVGDGKTNVEQGALLSGDVGTTTANTACGDSVVCHVSSLKISDGYSEGEQGAPKVASVGASTVDMTSEGAVVDNVSSVLTSDNISAVELEAPERAVATVDTTCAVYGIVDSVSSFAISDGTSAVQLEAPEGAGVTVNTTRAEGGVGLPEGANGGARSMGKTSQDSVMCITSSVPDVSDNPSGGVSKFTTPGVAPIVTQSSNPTDSGVLGEGEEAVVYDVRSSKLEERGPGVDEEVDKTLRSDRDIARESKQSVPAEMAEEGIIGEQSDSSLNSEQTASHKQQETETQDPIAAVDEESPATITEFEGDSLSVDNDSEFEEEGSEPSTDNASKGPRERLTADQFPVKERSRESQSDRSSDGSNPAERVDESETSCSEDESEEDRSSSAPGRNGGALAGSPELERSNSVSQATNPENANLDPKLNILELELRARAIRSLMKHCAAVEKLT